VNGGRQPGRRRALGCRLGPIRIGLLVLLVAAVAAASLAAVAFRAWTVELTAVRALTIVPQVEPGALATGPVMVLGGSAERVEATLALDAVGRDGRELIASASAATDLILFGRSCDEAGIRCVIPDPATTRGEARLAARLAEEEGWPALTVVTSNWHAHRAGRHFAACLAIPVRVLPAHDATLAGVPRPLLWREALGALDARLRPECRDLTS
jgi:hypothetical protein